MNRNHIRATIFLAIVSIAASCSSDSTGSGDIDAGSQTDGGVTVDASGRGDAAPPSAWRTLITSDWSLSAGTEGYQCERLTIEEDMYIVEFRATTPLGTHHSVLTIGNRNAPDGPSPCHAGTNANAMIYGAGIDTNPIALPDGVAMPVRAGQQLLLNLHLYNVSDAELTGTSAVEIRTIPQSEVVHEAEVLLMGKVATLQVPPGQSTQMGSCTMNGDVTLFMVNPHMHRYGTHMRVVAERAGMEDLEIYSGDYNFEDQQIYPIEPVSMNRWDTVRVYCSYNNTSGSPVPWGDSSDQEMCFATTYRYPARGSLFGIVCAND